MSAAVETPTSPSASGAPAKTAKTAKTKVQTGKRKAPADAEKSAAKRPKTSKNATGTGGKRIRATAKGTPRGAPLPKQGASVVAPSASAVAPPASAEGAEDPSENDNERIMSKVDRNKRAEEIAQRLAGQLAHPLKKMLFECDGRVLVRRLTKLEKLVRPLENKALPRPSMSQNTRADYVARHFGNESSARSSVVNMITNVDGRSKDSLVAWIKSEVETSGGAAPSASDNDFYAAVSGALLRLLREINTRKGQFAPENQPSAFAEQLDLFMINYMKALVENNAGVQQALAGFMTVYDNAESDEITAEDRKFIMDEYEGAEEEEDEDGDYEDPGSGGEDAEEDEQEEDDEEGDAEGDDGEAAEEGDNDDDEEAAEQSDDGGADSDGAQAENDSGDEEGADNE